MPAILLERPNKVHNSTFADTSKLFTDFYLIYIPITHTFD